MILYFGNMLSKHNYSPSFIETFTPKLQEIYEILSVSDKKNIFLRLLHMVYTLIYNKRKVSLVLIDSFSTKAFFYTYIIALLCQWLNIPYITLLHGGAFQKRLLLSPKISGHVFENSYLNVSPSFFLKKVFEEAGYNTIYIPNFIPIENYEFKQRMEVKPRLLWVRAFHEIYNPEMAVRVIYELSKKYDNVELCMVGADKDGTLGNVKKLVEELGLEKQVVFTGFLPKKEWLLLSKKYSIFINTTNFDNHPVSLIEAMALGLPIVSTNAGGVPYLVEDGEDALLVECDDSSSMTRMITKLIEDSAVTFKLSLAARKKSETFDWLEVKKMWVKVIDKVLKQEQ